MSNSLFEIRCRRFSRASRFPIRLRILAETQDDGRVLILPDEWDQYIFYLLRIILVYFQFPAARRTTAGKNSVISIVPDMIRPWFSFSSCVPILFFSGAGFRPGKRVNAISNHNEGNILSAASFDVMTA